MEALRDLVIIMAALGSAGLLGRIRYVRICTADRINDASGFIAQRKRRTDTDRSGFIDLRAAWLIRSARPSKNTKGCGNDEKSCKYF
jgi:hypothetical protein